MHRPNSPRLYFLIPTARPLVMLAALLLQTTTITPSALAADLDADDPARKHDYVFGGAELEASGIYGLLRPAGNGYQIVQWSDERDELSFQAGDEVLSLGMDMRHYFVPYLYKRKLDAAGSWMFGRNDECPTGHYHPCSSSFTKSDKSGSVVMGILTAGLTAMAGTMRKLDDKKIRTTAEQVDFVPLARHKLIERAVEFARMDSSLRGYDEALLMATPYISQEDRQTLLNERAAKAESQKQRQIAKKVRLNAEAAQVRVAEAQFRSVIKAGDETNCGMVIEVKGDIVQIQTSHNIKWVKKEELSPSRLRQACYVSP